MLFNLLRLRFKTEAVIAALCFVCLAGTGCGKTIENEFSFSLVEEKAVYIEIQVPYREIAADLAGKAAVAVNYSPAAYHNGSLYFVLSCSDSDMTQFPNLGEYLIKYDINTDTYEDVVYVEPGGMINKTVVCGEYLFWVVNANAGNKWQIFLHDLKDGETEIFAESKESITYSGNTDIAGSREYFTYSECTGEKSFKIHIYAIEKENEYIYTEKELRIISSYRLPDIADGKLLKIVSQYAPADIEIIDIEDGSTQWETELSGSYEYGFINSQGYLMYSSDFSNGDIWMINTESRESKKLYTAEEDNYRLYKMGDKFVVYARQAYRLEIIDTKEMTRTIYPLQKDYGTLSISGEYMLFSDGDICNVLQVSAEADEIQVVQNVFAKNNELSIMKYILPEGITAGEFDVFLGQGGGIPLLNSDDEEVGIVELHKATESHFKDGKLVRISSPDNHAGFVSEWEGLNTEIQGIFAEYSRDFGEHQEMWYAFWAEEDMKPIYAVSLFKEYWTKEQAVDFFNTVSFGN